MKLKKMTEVFLLIVSVLLILWVAISWVEVISKNMGPNPVYAPLNFFIMLMGGN